MEPNKNGVVRVEIDESVTINQLENMENNDTNIKNYLDKWICYALLLRMIEKRS